MALDIGSHIYQGRNVTLSFTLVLHSINFCSALVMDSMSPKKLSPYSTEAVENICSLLKCWKPNISLKTLAYEVTLYRQSLNLHYYEDHF